jgi:hypothetical protein
MGIRHHAAVGVLCAALALAGCAASRSGVGAQGVSPGASTPAAPTPVASSPPDGSPPAASPPGSVLPMVLSGQVEAGVEAGCLILRDAGKAYDLMGGDPTIVKAGARVRVLGHLAVGVMSHCMQGEPFQVTEAHAL